MDHEGTAGQPVFVVAKGTGHAAGVYGRRLFARGRRGRAGAVAGTPPGGGDGMRRVA